MMKTETIYDLQVIGGGPAGIGTFVASDRLYGLGCFLGNGAVLINPDYRLGSGGLRGLQIQSNSPGRDFLEAISERGRLDCVLSYDSVRVLERAGNSSLPLNQIAGFLEDLGREVGRVLEDHPLSGVIQGRVGRVVVLEDRSERLVFQSESWNSQTECFEPLARSRQLVVATGASEQLQDWQLNNGRNQSKVVLSRDVLTGQAFDKIKQRCRDSQGNQVAIIGASHSAWSVAKTLLGWSENLRVDILQRVNTQVFFQSREEADAVGYPYNLRDICPRTGRVNRFLGIRGEAKELFQQVQRGEERRVEVHRYSRVEELTDFLNQAAVAVQATGYRVNRLPILTPAGCVISEADWDQIDDHARLLDCDGGVIPGAYALGLGRSRLPIDQVGGETNARGRSIDGVNIYHGPIGELIAEAVLSHR